jgi:hypothetical protein
MPKYNEPPVYRLVQRREGSFTVLARDDPGVTHICPLRGKPSPDPYHRVLRILRWVSEVLTVGLVEDSSHLAALGEFEQALVAYLDARS